MPQRLRSEHPTAEAVMDYVLGRLTVEQENELDLHFADCSNCAETARLERLLLSVLESWTAANHRLARASRSFVDGLATVVRRPDLDQWQERLARWRDRVASGISGAVRLICRETATALDVDSLKPLLGPINAFDFRPLLRATGPLTRGGERPLSPPITIARAEGPGGCQVKIEVIAETSSIMVQLDALPTEWVPPLVLLLPFSNPNNAQIAEFVPIPATTTLQASFVGVPSGEYMLAFEPMESMNSRFDPQ